MPELPEVETVRAGMVRHLLGEPIHAAHIVHPRAHRRTVYPVEQVADTRITAIARRGKFLWCELDSGTALVLHLGMSGQILIDPRPAMPRTHLRAHWQIGEHEVWFVDQRTFGAVSHEPLAATADGYPGGWGSEQGAVPASIRHIARDPLDPHADIPALARQITASRSYLKALLLNQTVISGVGNIYADEALWRARLHPRTRGRRLSQVRARRLITECAAVMREAIAAGGTSFDALYVDVAGQSGWFERSLAAYGRTGLPCLRCGTPLVRDVVAGRSSHWCPHCTPTAGRVVA